MVDRNTEEQIAIRLHFHCRRLIDWRVMFGRGNPTGFRLGVRCLYNLVHHLHAIGTRLGCAGKHLNGRTTVVSQSEPQNSRIAILTGYGRANDVVESHEDGGLFLR